MPQKNHKKPNKLINEKSPYLQQHAYNPVDWHPWGDEAIELARKEDKPIFLSIGYSTCYWCHVMEREVFENEQIAELMNQYFINIKVDREERPDIDRIYMKALQALTGSGGWPMSVFLTPDLKPFYAATYIPPTAQYGRPGFIDVIKSIHNMWMSKKDKILESSDEITNHLKQTAVLPLSPTTLNLNILHNAYKSFTESYDETYGGFGGAPKFPTPVIFNFLLRYYNRTNEDNALRISLETLKHMARGGLYDNIGGGFHRYSTDERWHLPHFEKMLYDQAQLVNSYLDAYQITGEEIYPIVAQDVLHYVERMLTHPEGGFYSAEDAESFIDAAKDVKKEGAFYTWKKSEIDEIFTKEESDIICYYFGVLGDGNIRHDPHGIFHNENVLYIAHSVEETASHFQKSDDETQQIIYGARQKLFAAREKRPCPHRDEKILLSWNGLMISAFARAHQIFGNDKYLYLADKSAVFLYENLYDKNSKKFLRRFRDGEARFDAHLEDYAFFIQGIIDLYEATFNIKWVELATTLTEQKIELFYDAENGGFYDTTGEDPSVILRTKEWHDGAEPSGNSIAIMNLLRLSQIVNKKEWEDKAVQSLSHFGVLMEKAPQAVAQLLTAADFSLSKPKQIVVAGDPSDSETSEILRLIHQRYIPNKILLCVRDDTRQKLSLYNSFYESIKMIDGKPTVYVCENYMCDLPINEKSDLIKKLEDV